MRDAMDLRSFAQHTWDTDLGNHRSPQRLPELLSRTEIAELLASFTSINARTFLMTAYASAFWVKATGVMQNGLR